MCGEMRPFTTKSVAAIMKSAKTSTPAIIPTIIPTQNKGLCTSCDVTVWVVCGTKLQIKWCKGCKNFRNWAAFGEKGTATKCEKCRTRQREKYKEQRELKQKRKEQAAAVAMEIMVEEEDADEVDVVQKKKTRKIKSKKGPPTSDRKGKKQKTSMDTKDETTSIGLSHLIAAATQHA